jgi:hypothetical protein
LLLFFDPEDKEDDLFLLLEEDGEDCPVIEDNPPKPFMSPLWERFPKGDPGRLDRPPNPES